jgi:hypothetical protein
VVLWVVQLAFRLRNKMNIDQACEIMEHYAVQQDLEDLEAIEHMVKNYRNLDPNVRQALKVFMDTAKEMA